MNPRVTGLALRIAEAAYELGPKFDATEAEFVLEIGDLVIRKHSIFPWTFGELAQRLRSSWFTLKIAWLVRNVMFALCFF